MRIRVDCGRATPFWANSGTNCGSTLGEQECDGADGGDQQHHRIDHRRADGRDQAALALQQDGKALQRRGQRAARLAGAHEADQELGEAARLGRHGARQGAAVAHRVADAAEDGADARVGRGLDQVAQRAVEVLAGAEHGRELAGRPRRAAGG